MSCIKLLKVSQIVETKYFTKIVSSLLSARSNLWEKVIYGTERVCCLNSRTG